MIRPGAARARGGSHGGMTVCPISDVRSR